MVFMKDSNSRYVPASLPESGFVRLPAILAHFPVSRSSHLLLEFGLLVRDLFRGLGRPQMHDLPFHLTKTPIRTVTVLPALPMEQPVVSRRGALEAHAAALACGSSRSA
jgi:hypothetical protein